MYYIHVALLHGAWLPKNFEDPYIEAKLVDLEVVR